MNEKKLLNCPFCGGEAIILSEADYEAHAWYWVECNECGCKTGSYVDECGKEEAIENWNTREPLERIVQRLEAEREYHEIAAEEELEDFCLDMHHHHKDKARGIKEAIEIVKEEGGLNG